MGGRLYDARIGRVLQADPPFMESPLWSQGLNRYSYVFNNPLRWTDPSGYDVEDEEDYTGFDCDAGGCGDVEFGDDPLFATPPGEATDVDSSTEEAETSPSEDPDQGEAGEDVDRDDSESLASNEYYSSGLALLDAQLDSPVRPHSEAPTANLPHPTTAKEWGIHLAVWLARTLFNPSVANAPREEDTKTYAQQTNGELGVGAIPPWIARGRGLTDDAAREVTWSAHGAKHVASSKVPWSKVVAGTQRGPAKYKPGTQIETLERNVWASGTAATNGKPWKVMEFADDIGASAGSSSRWVRVEESAGTIHGHPITHAEFLKLTR